jgi:cephalosporin hydroxylase
VTKELAAYSRFVSKDSYIVAMDGIMKDLAGAPRSDADWETNNPFTAAREFVDAHSDFAIEEPIPPFNEGLIAERTPSYWPGAFIKRIS